MKQLQRIAVGQKPFQIGRPGLSLGHLYQMGVAVAARKLHHAEPVAQRVEAHGLAVDGHDRAEV
jgi:hypothetical protein